MKSEESMTYEVGDNNASIDKCDTATDKEKSNFKRMSKKQSPKHSKTISMATENDQCKEQHQELCSTTIDSKGRSSTIDQSSFTNTENVDFIAQKPSLTSSREEIFDLIDELSVFDELADCKTNSKSFSRSISTSIEMDIPENTSKFDTLEKTGQKSIDIEIDDTNSISIENGQSLSIVSNNNTVIPSTSLDSVNFNIDSNNPNPYQVLSRSSEIVSNKTNQVNSDISVIETSSEKYSKSLQLTNNDEMDSSKVTSTELSVDQSTNQAIERKSTASSKESLILKKKRSSNRKSNKDYETIRESKIKSRMTLFNAYKHLKKVAHASTLIDIFSPIEDNEKTTLILDFINNELGYVKCVKYVANFQKLLIDSMKNSSTAVLSKNEFNKLQLFYINLDQNMKRLEDLLTNKKRSTDSGIGIIDYFGELTPLRNDYKNIALYMDKLLQLIQKNKSNSKMKKIYPPDLVITEWNKSLSIEAAIVAIYERIHEYVKFLNSLLNATDKADPVYKHLRIVTNQFIIFWDVLNVSRIGKKNNNITRHLTITAPVVELNPDGKRKYRILYIFMDCLVISSQSPKSPTDLVSKYCLPLKKCVCSRNTSSNIDNIPSNDVYEKNINFLKGRIASNKDLVTKYEHSTKKSDTSKLEKLNRQINEDQYQLLLVTPQYPLSICYNHKLTQTFLFDNESDANYWEFIINGRSSCALLDEANVNMNEVQALVNDFTVNLLKTDNLSTEKQCYIEEPFIPPTTTEKEQEVAVPIDYMNHSLYINVAFKRHENLVGDISFKLEVDYYGFYFEKYKSNNIKASDSNCHSVLILTEHSQYIKLEVTKSKGKNDVMSSNPINLCELGILNKPFVRFREYFANVGTFIIYAECFPSELMFDCTKKIAINNINHFQPSIDDICESENTVIPDVLRLCVNKIEDLGLETVGLYRISGTTNRINQLREDFTKNLILDGDDLDEYDIHDLCGSVKSFLRDLNHRLIPTECVHLFLKWNENLKENNDISLLHDCVEKLPRSNQNSFYFLMNHLSKISRMSSTNKMSPANLSTVFGPNLFGGEQSDNAHQESLFTYVSIVKSFIEVLNSSLTNL